MFLWFVCVKEPGYETGDIIIVLDEREHDFYTRKGADLKIQMVYNVCIYSSYTTNVDLQCMYIHGLMSSCVGGSKAPPRTISGQHMLCACYIKNPLSDISTSCDRVVYLPYSGMIYVICVTEECNYVLGRQRARTRPAPRCLSAAFCALPRPQ